MSFIEGIGDEVVLFFVVVLVFAIAALITLVGSVPRTPTTTTVITTYEYELNSTVQREDSRTETSASSANSADSILRSRLNRVPVSITNSYIIDETTEEIDDNDDSSVGASSPIANDVEDTRTEADGSSLADSVEDTRTEADGSAELPDQNVGNHRTEQTSGNSESQGEEGVRRPGEIRVRLKYLNDTERIVNTLSSTKIGDFKTRHFGDVLRENKIVRLIFAGRLLHDQTTVEGCRIVDNSVVHVQVLPAQTAHRSQPAPEEAELDVGRLLVPAVTFLLGMCWVLYSKYPEFFSRLSLGVLGTLSCCFFAYVVHSRRQQ